MRQYLTLTVCILALTSCGQAGDPPTAHAAGVMSAQSSPQLPGVLVTAEWLRAQRIDTSSLVILDARSPEEYASGHLYGAISLPTADTYDVRSGFENDVAPIQTINALCSRSGISMQKRVVIYGERDDLREAARLFWVLEIHGHSRVAVLLDGYEGWVEAGGGTSQQPHTALAENFVAEFRPNRLVDKLQVRRAMRDDSVVLLDSRSHEEYRGDKVKAGLPRGGHIPTAINISAGVHEFGAASACALTDVDALSARYEGVQGKRVMTYCNTGRRAAVTYLALRALGITVSVYDGSWTEWATDPSLPAATGDAPGKAQ